MQKAGKGRAAGVGWWVGGTVQEEAVGPAGAAGRVKGGLAPYLKSLGKGLQGKKLTSSTWLFEISWAALRRTEGRGWII